MYIYIYYRIMWNPAFKNPSAHLPKFPKSFFPGAKRDGLRPRATYTEPIQRRMAAQRNAKRKAAAAATAAEKAPERPQTLTVLGDLQAERGAKETAW